MPVTKKQMEAMRIAGEDSLLKRSTKMNTCSACIRDVILADRIGKSGFPATCDFCGIDSSCISLDELSDEIDALFRAHYQPGEQDYYFNKNGDPEFFQKGQTAEEVISEILDCSHDIASALYELLRKNSYKEYKDTGESYYDSEGYARQVIDGHHGGTWERYCFSIKHNRRFFENEHTAILDKLFANLKTYATLEGEGAVRKLQEGETVYRGRIIEGQEDIINIVMNPHIHLGPPPSISARANRMNPTGIPVFYGAMDIHTCIAECRVPIGGEVFVGRFRLLRDVTILDLTILENIASRISMFDPRYDEVISETSFLRNFHEHIKKPILPRDAELEYIPTQALAEYLLYFQKIEGVIYSSSQNVQGKNITLFTNNEITVPNNYLPYYADPVTAYFSLYESHDDMAVEINQYDFNWKSLLGDKPISVDIESQNPINIGNMLVFDGELIKLKAQAINYIYEERKIEHHFLSKQEEDKLKF